MKIALIGATGAGKSTVAQKLHSRLNYTVISTGEFVRKNFPNDPLEGGFSDREKQILEYVDQNLKKDRVVLDGFPRHVRQAEWLTQRFKPDELLVVIMRIGRLGALHRIRCRGRDDMEKFDQMFDGQARALEAIELHLVYSGYSNLVVGPLWSADDILDRVQFVYGQRRRRAKC